MLEKKIHVPRKDQTGFKNFLKELIELSKEGYEPDWEKFNYNSKPRFNRFFSITVFKKIDKNSLDLTIIEDRSSKKEDLLKLAEDLGINVPPESAKYPAAIRKLLKENLQLIKEIDSNAE